MEPSETISATLLRYGVPIAGQPIKGSETGSPYIAHILVARDAQGRQEPSQKRLVEAKAIVEAQGIPIEFVLINQRIEHAEQNLRAGMLASHGDLIRNIFLTTRGSKTEVWVETKSKIDLENGKAIEKAIFEFGRVNRIKSIIIRLMDEKTIPTSFEILSTIRRVSPVSCETLKEELEVKSFSVPSLDWVNRKFDALRKAGLVVRISDRKYALTLEGLHRLGTRKSRSSPDIARLLALARSGG